MKKLMSQKYNHVRTFLYVRKTTQRTMDLLAFRMLFTSLDWWQIILLIFIIILWLVICVSLASVSLFPLPILFSPLTSHVTKSRSSPRYFIPRKILESDLAYAFLPVFAQFPFRPRSRISTREKHYNSISFTSLFVFIFSKYTNTFYL